MEYPQWFFMWTSGKPYITMICGWTKKDVMKQVERENGQSWRKIYERGGRIVKVEMSIAPSSRPPARRGGRP